MADLIYSENSAAIKDHSLRLERIKRFPSLLELKYADQSYICDTNNHHHELNTYDGKDQEGRDLNRLTKILSTITI